MACTATIAIVVPKFAHLMGIVGAVGCTTLAFTLPSHYYLRLFPGVSAGRKAMLYAIMVFGQLAGAFSVYLSFQSMIEEGVTSTPMDMDDSKAMDMAVDINSAGRDMSDHRASVVVALSPQSVSI